MNSASYNISCNVEMRWDGDRDGAGDEDDVYDDLQDACDDGDVDGDDLPFREVFFQAESARRRWLLFSRFPQRSGGRTLKLLLPLRFLGHGGRNRPKGGAGGVPRCPGGHL